MRETELIRQVEHGDIDLSELQVVASLSLARLPAELVGEVIASLAPAQIEKAKEAIEEQEAFFSA